MLVQITLEILFQNEKSTMPGALIITLTIYLPCLFRGAGAAEHAVSDSLREVWLRFNITCSGQRVGAGLRTHIKTVRSESIRRCLVLTSNTAQPQRREQ